MKTMKKFIDHQFIRVMTSEGWKSLNVCQISEIWNTGDIGASICVRMASGHLHIISHKDSIEKLPKP